MVIMMDLDLELDLEASNNKVKKRSKNFTGAEISCLMSLVRKYRQFLENRRTDSKSNQLKQSVWMKIVAEFNNSPYCTTYRTVVTLKGKYENLKKQAKAKLTKNEIPNGNLKMSSSFDGQAFTEQATGYYSDDKKFICGENFKSLSEGEFIRHEDAQQNSSSEWDETEGANLEEESQNNSLSSLDGTPVENSQIKKEPVEPFENSSPNEFCINSVNILHEIPSEQSETVCNAEELLVKLKEETVKTQNMCIVKEHLQKLKHAEDIHKMTIRREEELHQERLKIMREQHQIKMEIFKLQLNKCDVFN